MIRKTVYAALILTITVSCSPDKTGDTEITKWQNDRAGAVSLTFDDSTINQFRVALPLMDTLGLPGTFYIITGSVPGSAYEGEFIGRPVEEIITETEEVSTNEENLFERASAIRYLGYADVHQYYTEAGQYVERGEIDEAISVVDEAYERVRNGEYVQSEDYFDQYLYDRLYIDSDTELITWEELQTFDGDFHEFGSHTITHPYLAVLDEENILYELEGSKEDLERHLGVEHTFSVEAPYGTRNDRVMEYLYEVYPANRNRMPEPWLEEIHRGDEMDPGASDQEYVQWQRGPLTDTPMDLMKSWVDTSIAEDNIWLVLVFHGVEGIGWEPKSEEELDEYFNYIKDREDDLWVATFADGTKYIQQRMNADVSSEVRDGGITVTLTHSLGQLYDLPLTLKTNVPSQWESVEVQQGDNVKVVQVEQGEENTYVLYQAYPNIEPVELREA